MKVTVEIELDDRLASDSVSREQLPMILESVFGYSSAFIRMCNVKAGRMEVHETGVFGAVYKYADNVKVTIDRSE